jgi:hypothetical protein
MSNKPSEPPDIPGADALAAWFGHWPSFHDAEVLELHLRRRGVSELTVHTWAAGPVDRATGYYTRANECVVRFSMEVVDLDLADFSPQNVIAGLRISPDPRGWCLELSPCYGLAGKLWCQSISVSFVPGASPAAERERTADAG